MHFVKTGKLSKENGKLFNDLYDRRQKGDYNDFYEFDENTVLSYIKPVELFISEITKLIEK